MVNRRRNIRVGLAGMVAGLILVPPSWVAAGVLAGTVRDAAGPVVGAMVSAQHGDPIHTLTVFTDAEGFFRTPDVEADRVELRVRRIGWKDHRVQVEVPEEGLLLELERETDPAALAAQLPAHRWLSLLTAQIDDPTHREQFVRQCTYCHQQGNQATRVPREDWQWEKVLSLMARMGGILPEELRAQVPELFRAAYDPATAIPVLTANADSPDFAPAPSVEARQAVVEEWELGMRASMQHDLIFHPDGRAYSVDMTQDHLYRLDPASGEMASFPIESDLSLGGAFGGRDQPMPPTANAREGPHSLQVGPDGDIWITFALGNKMGRFDTKAETWKTYPLEEGYYPHTLRIDGKGRVWFTLAVSNHLGMFDPETETFRTQRLPAGSLGQDLVLRMLPVILWLADEFGGSSGVGMEGGDPDFMPVPYGIDIAPDGSVWFSQLNQHRIGRIDPDTFEVEMIDTPFPAPRRLRFDAKNGLWIPSFSSGLLARFDVVTRDFKEWTLPTSKEGVETPYSLNVNRPRNEVWICGTNSDTLMRFQPESESFTVYPLPTRVTFTRDIDFDEQGRVWTSNSNLPTWQVEGGFPRVLRLDPAGGAAARPVQLVQGVQP
ncbi:MAG: hypothetical protein GY937_18835 [bacterium]|nr:hypothetical protein [bacterium]